MVYNVQRFVVLDFLLRSREKYTHKRYFFLTAVSIDEWHLKLVGSIYIGKISIKSKHLLFYLFFSVDKSGWIFEASISNLFILWENIRPTPLKVKSGHKLLSCCRRNKVFIVLLPQTTGFDGGHELREFKVIWRTFFHFVKPELIQCIQKIVNSEEQWTHDYASVLHIFVASFWILRLWYWPSISLCIKVDW